jgi:hypothetical protein
MKPKARGTRRDPRALKHEQWIVKVRMLDHGRTVQVPADQAKWEKIARERPGQSQVSHGQVHRNRLGR